MLLLVTGYSMKYEVALKKLQYQIPILILLGENSHNNTSKNREF
jgi:hypothetical protein